MALSAHMSLWGLNQYDNTILAGLLVPKGMDKDVVVDNLLLETASMDVLYTDPVFLKASITVWSQERIDVWQKLYDTTLLEYNPIENYDRIEEAQEDNTGHTQTADQRSSSGNTTTTGSRTAYDSGTFADTDRAVQQGSDSASGSGSADSSSQRILKSRIHGNIGVTSSQQLLESQRSVVQFCMTEYIINDFISRFCIAVY